MSGTGMRLSLRAYLAVSRWSVGGQLVRRSCCRTVGTDPVGQLMPQVTTAATLAHQPRWSTERMWAHISCVNTRALIGSADG